MRTLAIYLDVPEDTDVTLHVRAKRLPLMPRPADAVTEGELVAETVAPVIDLASRRRAVA